MGMTIDGTIYAAEDEVVFLRLFVAFLKEHGGKFSGYISALASDPDNPDIVGTFDWDELIAKVET